MLSKFPEATELLPYACNPWELLTALCYQCGLELSLTGEERLFQNCCPFDEQQVKSLPIRVKVLLPPSSCCDGGLMLDEWFGWWWRVRDSVSLIQSKKQKDIEEANCYLDTSSRILSSLHSKLLPSSLYYQAQFFYNHAEFHQAVIAASSSINNSVLYDNSFIQSLSILFAANTDPLNLIRDINDIIARYCGTSSFVIPQLVFAVGLLAYSQDPSLGMEYISRAVTLAREIFGEDHIATARIQEKVGDVRVCWRVDV